MQAFSQTPGVPLAGWAAWLQGTVGLHGAVQVKPDVSSCCFRSLTCKDLGREQCSSATLALGHHLSTEDKELHGCTLLSWLFPMTGARSSVHREAHCICRAPLPAGAWLLPTQGRRCRGGQRIRVPAGGYGGLL